MLGEGEDDQQSCEEVVDQVGKQNVWGDADSGYLVINKTELKGARCQAYPYEQGNTFQSYRGNSCTFYGKSAWLVASLKCLCSHTYSVGFKEEELHVCMQLQSYDFVGIMKI